MPFAIDLPSDETHVKPNESRQITFTLRDASGQPLSGRVIQLLIVDASRARGATLSLDRGVTGAAGEMPVQIIGGQPTEFTVRASSAGAADRELRVHVTAQDSGPVAVGPEIIAAPPGASVALIRISLYEAMGCAAVVASGSVPPGSAKITIRNTTPGKPIVFGAVSAAGGHAVFGQGFDAAGVPVVRGCVDLSGTSVLSETTIHVVLPLSPVDPSIVGRFAAVSQLRFTQEYAPLGAIRTAWRELDACELDPARLWLDCTVDALAPTAQGPNDPPDPLDCRPSAADEAAFGGRLTARRGLPVPTTTDIRCRQAFDGAGHASLEKQIAAMFTNLPQRLAEVKAIAAEADKLLDTFRVHSTMTFTPTSQPGRLQLDHALGVMEIGIGATTIMVGVPSLGGASPSARFVPVEATRSDVRIDRHGFTLRLGSATRIAFLEGALGRRMLPTDPAAFVNGLFAAASYADRGTTFKGCPALGALVCPLVGAPDGCLAAACEKGLAGLGRGLTNVFDQLDGEELDFFLQGSGPLVDADGDGLADAVGRLPTNPGVWKAIVRPRDEPFAISGFFAADRAP